ncbi:MAG TPA: Lrp/AsnC family transcriptional regulator [Ramlibacter sp.]|nr:Lrp/AsnC family transcriptional regulator [Ramlibacter sp.]
MDKTDRAILAILQRDATLSVAEIAAQVHLSPTPCWRRIQRLEEQGYITKRVALLDPEKLNLGVTVFVSIKTSQHSEAWFQKFHRVVTAIPEVVEFYRMSGDVDYLLRIVVPDIKRYDWVYKQLIKGTDLHDVSSSFAMEQLKLTTELPLDYAD